MSFMRIKSQIQDKNKIEQKYHKKAMKYLKLIQIHIKIIFERGKSL